MTTVTGSDGKTYTFENGVLTISGSGEANAMRSGSITGLDASTMHTLIVESGITSLGQELMFRGCTGLTSVTLPEGLTNIGSYDFMECTNLTSIRLPSTLTNLAGYVFYGCTKLAEIIFTGNQPSIRDLALSTNRSSGTTIYSTGWANSTTITSTVTGSTVMTFVDSVPTTYKKITLNGSKIQVDSAVRDGTGKKIDTSYLPITGGTLQGSLTLTGNNGITSNNIIFNDWKLNVNRSASGKLYRYVGIDANSTTGWLKTRGEDDVKNDLGINDKLDKLAYEWNKDLSVNVGTAGYVLLFDGYTYDSGVVIDIDCTTAQTYHGTLVIATQNSVPKLAKVYGDANNTITPALYIVPPTGMTSDETRRMKVYLVPQGWSKNFVRVRAGGLYSPSSGSSTCPMTFTEGSVPSDATWRPTNALDSKLDKVTDNVGYMRAYAIASDGTQTTYSISGGVVAGSIAMRSTGGVLSVGIPTADAHAATKAYVDGKSQIVTNTSVSSWSSDNTYSEYGYRASIAITGVTASDVAEVMFGLTEATSGKYAPVCETYAGGVYIYSTVNDSITIPTIIIFKG